MAGHRIPASNASFYAGTKFMVRALAEGLRQELKAANSKIRVAVSFFFHIFLLTCMYIHIFQLIFYIALVGSCYNYFSTEKI